jgi:bifunctional enzyme CysN/CysC
VKKKSKNLFKFVTVGHVDHGKSSLIGRLLADTGNLPKGKLESIRKYCRQNNKDFEYAFLLDALADERKQGITIDMARCFFSYAERNYLLLDAPGHREFIKNMVTGSASASAAILVVDSSMGVEENTKTHSYLLSFLGVKEVIVAVNKMDLIAYSQSKFDKIRDDLAAYLESLGLNCRHFIPVSAKQGDNLIGASIHTSWYNSSSLMKAIEELSDTYEAKKEVFRMYLQDIYRFSKGNDQSRYFVGKIESGELASGDRLVFYPSQKSASVSRLLNYGGEDFPQITTGMSATLTLSEQLYLKRGELICKEGDPPPKVANEFIASVFWMGKVPMQRDHSYVLKMGSRRVLAKLAEIIEHVDIQTLTSVKFGSQIEKYSVAKCRLMTMEYIAFDLINENMSTARFIIVEDYEICGGGIITESINESELKYQDSNLHRGLKSIKGGVCLEDRVQYYGHRPLLVLICGDRSSKKGELGGKLEEILLNLGRHAFLLATGTLKYGLDSDLTGETLHAEGIRRFGERACLLLEAGMIVIASSNQIEENDLERIQDSIDKHQFVKILLNSDASGYDLQFGPADEERMILKTLIEKVNSLI